MINLLSARKAPEASIGEAAVAADVGMPGMRLDDSQLEAITAGSDSVPWASGSEEDDETPVLSFAS